MAEKFPFLARQINGKIAEILGNAVDSVYEKDVEFIEFLSSFSLLDNQYFLENGDWLDMLGTALGIPRPYRTLPEKPFAFRYDTIPDRLDGHRHGFSEVPPTTETGQGGLLDSVTGEKIYQPISNERYIQYIHAVCLAKHYKSITAIADIYEAMTNSVRYTIEFYGSTPPVNDIQIMIPLQMESVVDSLEGAFSKLFYSSPKVMILPEMDYDDNNTIPNMERIAEEAAHGETDITITVDYDEGMAYFSVVLGPLSGQYESEVREALDEVYGGTDDMEITVTVGD